MGTLDTLPLEILLLIFEYCTLRDLTNLHQVCTRFHQIICSDICGVWKSYDNNNFLVTNQVSEQFRKRCNLLLPIYSKCFISHNWIHGVYQQHILSKQQKQNHEETSCFTEKTFCSRKKIEEKITKFTFWRDYIITGYNTGGIKWQVESPVSENNLSKYIIKKEMVVHDKSLRALDAASNFICSASSHEYVILRVPNSLDLDSIDEDNIIQRHITPKLHVSSLACHPLGTKLSVSLSGTISKVIHIDLEYGRTEMELGHCCYRIRDILWEDQNTLLTCGGNRIEKWDLRICTCVEGWTTQQKLLQLTCISSDHHNTMITGTKHNCAILWDQRMSEIVQVCINFHNGINPCILRTSKVGSLKFSDILYAR